MRKWLACSWMAVLVSGVAGCGGQSSQTSAVATSTARGTLSENPPFRIASLNAADFKSKLASTTQGAGLLELSGAPACGVDFYYLRFWTVGGAKEVTESSGALMVPTGGSSQCSGPRPIVLYGHGTNVDKAFNIADPTDPANTEGVLIAAMFAAQGYIVVAPNYAGYDISTLGYHPYLDAEQQSGEMLDILAAARAGLPKTLSAAASDSGKLFLAGYSQGGHVSMATQRALQAEGKSVAGAAHMSGPYALEAFGDAIVFGKVDLDSTIFIPLIVNSYQHAYGNIYSSPGDLYSATYAGSAPTALPTDLPVTEIFSKNILPQTALWDSSTPQVQIPNDPALSAVLTAALAVPGDPTDPFTPLFDLGFGNPYLVNNTYREAMALDAAQDPDGAAQSPPVAGAPLADRPPQQPLRLALYENDLRNGAWAPTAPTLLCGSSGDPTVFFSLNTQVMASFWSAQVQAHLITVLDVGASPAGSFEALQAGFQLSEQQQLAFYESAAGGSESPQAAALSVLGNYHESIAPFCAAAARAFFSEL